MNTSEIIPINPERRDSSVTKNREDVGLGKVENISRTELLNMFGERIRYEISTPRDYSISSNDGSNYVIGKMNAAGPFICAILFLDKDQSPIDSFFMEYQISPTDVEFAHGKIRVGRSSNLDNTTLEFVKTPQGEVYIYVHVSFWSVDHRATTFAVNILMTDTSCFTPLKPDAVVPTVSESNKISQSLLESIDEYARSAKSLAIYDQDGNLVNPDLVPEEGVIYDYPTINDYKFTGNGDYRKVNITARHTLDGSPADKDTAGIHDWECLDKITLDTKVKRGSTDPREIVTSKNNIDVRIEREFQKTDTLPGYGHSRPSDYVSYEGIWPGSIDFYSGGSDIFSEAHSSCFRKIYEGLGTDDELVSVGLLKRIITPILCLLFLPRKDYNTNARICVDDGSRIDPNAFVNFLELTSTDTERLSRNIGYAEGNYQSNIYGIKYYFSGGGVDPKILSSKVDLSGSMIIPQVVCEEGEFTEEDYSPTTERSYDQSTGKTNITFRIPANIRKNRRVFSIIFRTNPYDGNTTGYLYGSTLAYRFIQAGTKDIIFGLKTLYNGSSTIYLYPNNKSGIRATTMTFESDSTNPGTTSLYLGKNVESSTGTTFQYIDGWSDTANYIRPTGNNWTEVGDLYSYSDNNFTATLEKATDGQGVKYWKLIANPKAANLTLLRNTSTLKFNLYNSGANNPDNTLTVDLLQNSQEAYITIPEAARTKTIGYNSEFATIEFTSNYGKEYLSPSVSSGSWIEFVNIEENGTSKTVTFRTLSNNTSDYSRSFSFQITGALAQNRTTSSSVTITQNPNEHIFRIDGTSQGEYTNTYSHLGNSPSVTISTNSEWTVTYPGGNDWISVRKNSVDGSTIQSGGVIGQTGSLTVSNTNIFFVLSRNTGDSSRSMIITFTSGEETRTLTIVQKQLSDHYINLSPVTIQYEKYDEVDDRTFQIESNCEYEIKNIPEWLTVAPQVGGQKNEESTLTVTVHPTGHNTGSVSRTASLQINPKDGVQLESSNPVVTITQAGQSTLALTPSELEFGPTELSKTISLTSNANWLISNYSARPGWITSVTPDQGAMSNPGVVVNLKENTDYTSARSWVLEFQATSEGASVSKNLSITQRIATHSIVYSFKPGSVNTGVKVNGTKTSFIDVDCTGIVDLNTVLQPNFAINKRETTNETVVDTELVENETQNVTVKCYKGDTEVTSGFSYQVSSTGFSRIRLPENTSGSETQYTLKFTLSKYELTDAVVTINCKVATNSITYQPASFTFLYNSTTPQGLTITSGVEYTIETEITGGNPNYSISVQKGTGNHWSVLANTNSSVVRNHLEWTGNVLIKSSATSETLATLPVTCQRSPMRVEMVPTPGEYLSYRSEDNTYYYKHDTTSLGVSIKSYPEGYYEQGDTVSREVVISNRYFIGEVTDSSYGNGTLNLTCSLTDDRKSESIFVKGSKATTLMEGDSNTALAKMIKLAKPEVIYSGDSTSYSIDYLGGERSLPFKIKSGLEFTKFLVKREVVGGETTFTQQGITDWEKYSELSPQYEATAVIDPYYGEAGSSRTIKFTIIGVGANDSEQYSSATVTYTQTAPINVTIERTGYMVGSDLSYLGGTDVKVIASSNAVNLSMTQAGTTVITGDEGLTITPLSLWTKMDTPISGYLNSWYVMANLTKNTTGAIKDFSLKVKGSLDTKDCYGYAVVSQKQEPTVSLSLPTFDYGYASGSTKRLTITPGDNPGEFKGITITQGESWITIPDFITESTDVKAELCGTFFTRKGILSYSVTDIHDNVVSTGSLNLAQNGLIMDSIETIGDNVTIINNPIENRDTSLVISSTSTELSTDHCLGINSTRKESTTSTHELYYLLPPSSLGLSGTKPDYYITHMGTTVAEEAILETTLSAKQRIINVPKYYLQKVTSGAGISATWEKYLSAITVTGTGRLTISLGHVGDAIEWDVSTEATGITVSKSGEDVICNITSLTGSAAINITSEGNIISTLTLTTQQ